MNSNTFLDWFRYAVDRVGIGYFGHAERVYCYELYHFIRVAMYHYERQNGPIGDIFLHSELVKPVMTMEDASRYEVWPLPARRMPDFLFHTPGNFDNQIAAIEVKTSSALSREHLLEDLIKLTDLRQNYRYRLTIFHCVNISIERLRQLLTADDPRLADLDREIQVECKPAYGHILQSCRLGELFT